MADYEGGQEQGNNDPGMAYWDAQKSPQQWLDDFQSRERQLSAGVANGTISAARRLQELAAMRQTALMYHPDLAQALPDPQSIPAPTAPVGADAGYGANAALNQRAGAMQGGRFNLDPHTGYVTDNQDATTWTSLAQMAATRPDVKAAYDAETAHISADLPTAANPTVGMTTSTGQVIPPADASGNVPPPVDMGTRSGAPPTAGVPAAPAAPGTPVAPPAAPVAPIGGFRPPGATSGALNFGSPFKMPPIDPNGSASSIYGAYTGNPAAQVQPSQQQQQQPTGGFRMPAVVTSGDQPPPPMDDSFQPLGGFRPPPMMTKGDGQSGGAPMAMTQGGGGGGFHIMSAIAPSPVNADGTQNTDGTEGGDDTGSDTGSAGGGRTGYTDPSQMPPTNPGVGRKWEFSTDDRGRGIWKVIPDPTYRPPAAPPAPPQQTPAQEKASTGSANASNASADSTRARTPSEIAQANAAAAAAAASAAATTALTPSQIAQNQASANAANASADRTRALTPLEINQMVAATGLTTAQIAQINALLPGQVNIQNATVDQIRAGIENLSKQMGLDTSKFDWQKITDSARLTQSGQQQSIDRQAQIENNAIAQGRLKLDADTGYAASARADQSLALQGQAQGAQITGYDAQGNPTFAREQAVSDSQRADLQLQASMGNQAAQIRLQELAQQEGARQFDTPTGEGQREYDISQRLRQQQQDQGNTLAQQQFGLAQQTQNQGNVIATGNLGVAQATQAATAAYQAGQLALQQGNAEEAKRQFDIAQKLQQQVQDQSYGLSEQQLAENQRQFNVTNEQAWRQNPASVFDQVWAARGGAFKPPPTVTAPPTTPTVPSTQQQQPTAPTTAPAPLTTSAFKPPTTMTTNDTTGGSGGSGFQELGGSDLTTPTSPFKPPPIVTSGTTTPTTQQQQGGPTGPLTYGEIKASGVEAPGIAAATSGGFRPPRYQTAGGVPIVSGQAYNQLLPSEKAVFDAELSATGNNPADYAAHRAQLTAPAVRTSGGFSAPRRVGAGVGL